PEDFRIGRFLGKQFSTLLWRCRPLLKRVNVGRDSNKTNLSKHGGHIANVLLIWWVSGYNDHYRKSAFLVRPGQVAIEVFRSALERNSSVNHIHVIQSLYHWNSVSSIGLLCFEFATQDTISREHGRLREKTSSSYILSVFFQKP